MAKRKLSEPIKPMSLGQMQMSTERLMEFIQSRNFGSIEEINEFFRNNVNGKRIDEAVPKIAPGVSNQQKANDFMYEAYECTPAKGKKLAKDALKLDSENIRALNYLAEQEKSAEGALKLYQQAVGFGKKQLGENFFNENKGHFWIMIETRPYMTAKLGFAQCLEALDWKDEAINEFSEMIELNPGDNQGVRYMLASLLLFTGKYKAFFELYKKFKDEKSAFWLYNYALYLFATESASVKANRALLLAHQENPNIIDFMTQRKVMTKNPEGHYSPGDENEAAYYLMDNFRSWMNVENTLDWLFRFVETIKK
jgi:hypothetical protein